LIGLRGAGFRLRVVENIYTLEFGITKKIIGAGGS
jgi:hypothetical protein